MFHILDFMVYLILASPIHGYWKLDTIAFKGMLLRIEVCKHTFEKTLKCFKLDAKDLRSHDPHTQVFLFFFF